MTVKEFVDVGRTNKAAERQVKAIEGGQNSTVAAVQHDRRQKQQKLQRKRSDAQRPSAAGQLCRFCGRHFPHHGGTESCPAFNTLCQQCSKIGHFETVCKSAAKPRVQSSSQPSQQFTPSAPSNSQSTKSTGCCRQVHQVHNDSEDDDYDRLNPDSMSKHDQPTMSLKVNNHSLRFLVNSGGSINVIDEPALATLKRSRR